MGVYRMVIRMAGPCAVRATAASETDQEPALRALGAPSDGLAPRTELPSELTRPCKEPQLWAL